MSGYHERELFPRTRRFYINTCGSCGTEVGASELLCTPCKQIPMPIGEGFTEEKVKTKNSH